MGTLRVDIQFRISIVGRRWLFSACLRCSFFSAHHLHHPLTLPRPLPECTLSCLSAHYLLPPAHGSALTFTGGSPGQSASMCLSNTIQLCRSPAVTDEVWALGPGCMGSKPFGASASILQVGGEYFSGMHLARVTKEK